ncbi:class I SAM-dependent methyltransferase [bacterium]|nr:class I SAM-dependent methyltransferase [candidate division CSSED10-310 bacterium]
MKESDCAPLYSDGRQYDAFNRSFQEDIPFYLWAASEFGDPVLEIACGTGRLTIPLAAAGHDITGLDASAGMLETARVKARERGLSIPWVRADCRSFEMARRFGLIFIPFNSIAHLHDLEEIHAMLGRVREHLLPAGVFIVDIFVPDMRILIRDPRRRYPVAKYLDPGGGMITLEESNLYDPITQVNHITWYYRSDDGRTWNATLNMRIFFPEELTALLEADGFEIVQRFGDFDRGPPKTDSPKQLVICRQVR